MTNIKELMTAHPHLIHPESTMRDAAKKMQEFDCGCLVAGEGDTLEGMLTDRDIVVWGLGEGHDPDRATVSDIMTPDAITAYEDQTIEHAADLMADRDVRRLVILNRQDKVVGVLSIADMVKCSDSDAINDDVIHHLFKYA
jgi:CBS domain-containing protein